MKSGEGELRTEKSGINPAQTFAQSISPCVAKNTTTLKKQITIVATLSIMILSKSFAALPPAE